jgi:NAD(P)-dependent dehydrogenase (short-subunit alcohol dehydrogenase family)
VSAGSASLPDAVLDRTVLGSYTRLGYALRSPHWNDSELRRMDGEVVIVTGATSGLGEAAAAGFARLGATVWLVVRNVERGERARARIAERTGHDELLVATCDLSEMSSVRRFAREFAERSPRLDVLVNNAGLLTRERSLSADGIELTLAINVLAPVLLTTLLVPVLESSAPSRVINVSSGGMYTQGLHLDDLQSAEGRFRGAVAYSRSKRIEVVLTERWAERLQGTGVVVNSMHPGWVDTPGLRDSLPAFRRLMRPLLRTAEQGADTIVWLGAAAPAGELSGGFWLDHARRPTHVLPWSGESDADRQRLWEAVQRLAGV